jgi:hypothetical protein
MGKINMSRVLLGGLIAGVVINAVEGLVNGVLFEADWVAALGALQKPTAFSVKQIVFFNVAGFAFGMLMMLAYAAMRPRLGAGASTAMCAGALVWTLGIAIPNSFNAITHIFPLALMLKLTAIGLVEMAAAGVAGAYFYKEEAAPQAMSAASGR